MCCTQNSSRKPSLNPLHQASERPGQKQEPGVCVSPAHGHVGRGGPTQGAEWAAAECFRQQDGGKAGLPLDTALWEAGWLENGAILNS